MKTIGARSAAWCVGMAGLVLAGFVACGSDKKEDDDSTDKKLSFTDDINPILKASCSGTTGCHQVGTKESVQYVDKEASFKSSSAAARLQLPSTDPSFMPKSTATEKHSITDADKQKLLDFLAQ